MHLSTALLAERNRFMAAPIRLALLLPASSLAAESRVVERVLVEGNRHTASEFIRRTLGVAPGDASNRPPCGTSNSGS